jgi:protocatechuate 3,4-dioxygenase beta subunit
MTPKPLKATRRGFLRASIALSASAAFGWAALGRMPASFGGVQAQGLALTPECADADDLTPSQTEGPYFTANSPETTSLLEAGSADTRLVVSGFVLTTACQPVSGALLDFWQADARGEYDNVGYRYRGHQFTDAEGRFYLETVVPGLYPGRTRHIHVKVQAPGARVLTSQLYFPGEPRNARDSIYLPELEMSVSDDGVGGKTARFDFVVVTA